jgi:tRNA (guanosine-2'-O-)-methyltransferase
MDEKLLLEQFLSPERKERLKQAAAFRTRNVCVVLDGVHDPHNLSAVVRSCDAFGLLDLHVIESQKRFRCERKISIGAEKWLDIHRYQNAGTCADTLLGQGYEMWVAVPSEKGVEISQVPWERRLAIVFGNEHTGISAEMGKAASGRFYIPMCGFVESLNVSVAAGIALAISVRERMVRLGWHGDLSDVEQSLLVEQWQRRAVRHSEDILRELASRRQQK